MVVKRTLTDLAGQGGGNHRGENLRGATEDDMDRSRIPGSEVLVVWSLARLGPIADLGLDCFRRHHRGGETWGDQVEMVVTVGRSENPI